MVELPPVAPQFDFVRSVADLTMLLRRNAHYGVFIDDTGAPGDNKLKFVPGDRKTWVATIVRPGQAQQLFEGYLTIFGRWRDRLHIRELHFVDVYGGTKEFKGVPWPDRFQLIEDMLQLFENYSLTVLVQSMRPNEIKDWQRVLNLPPALKPFHFSKAADLALFLLLLRVNQRLSAMAQVQSGKAFVIVDEGWRKKNLGMQFIPGAFDAFAGSAICFADSIECPFLQIADFAAFFVNRYQVIQGRQKINYHDRQILKRLRTFASTIDGFRSRNASILIHNESGKTIELEGLTTPEGYRELTLDKAIDLARAANAKIVPTE